MLLVFKMRAVRRGAAAPHIASNAIQRNVSGVNKPLHFDPTQLSSVEIGKINKHVLTPMDRATLPHAKSTIALHAKSNRQAASAASDI